MTAGSPLHPPVTLREAGVELIVVGASAGGVDSLCRLLGALPADFRIPIAIVLHLPPGRPSMLAEVLGNRCALRVEEPEDKAPIEPGHVYCAGSDCHLQVEPERRFSLSVDDALRYSRPSIDVLFESAAFAYRDRLLAIVLTGANDDGAQGLATVRQQGGLAWVQQPGEAVADVMPRAAIARAGADAILPLHDIRVRLQRIAQARTPDPKDIAAP